MEKNFDSWNDFKKSLDKNHKPPFFNEGQIWWCSIGINIGYEVFGKHNLFNRPVIILKKFSHYTFLGLPMTSSIKDATSHFPITFNEIQCSVLIQQARTLDSRRLGKKIGELSKDKLLEIKKAFKNFL